MFPQELIGVWFEDPDMKSVPLHLDRSSEQPDPPWNPASYDGSPYTKFCILHPQGEHPNADV